MTIPSKNCNVYVAMLADAYYASQSSCMNVDQSNKSFLGIDLSDYCPALSLAHIPAPRQALCFSGQKLVEIKHFGHAPISQLCIGDYVMSSDDKFKQVYGFGHFDHNQDGTFLQIRFHNDNGIVNSNYKNQESLAFIELSVQLLIMIERKDKQHRVPASNIKVDDIMSDVKTVTRSIKSKNPLIKEAIRCFCREYV
jgi:hypothetical protein